MLSLLFLAPLILADNYVIPTTNPSDSWSTSGSCYPISAVPGLTLKGSNVAQTSLLCESQCGRQAVIALLNGGMCYCGDTYPQSSLAVDSSNCNVPCNGYGTENCGGSNYYMVYENATPQSAKSASSSQSSTSTASSSKSSSTSTSATQTSSTSSSSTTTSSSSSSSTTSSSSSSSPSSSSSVTSSSQSQTTSSSTASKTIATTTSTLVTTPSTTASSSVPSTSSSTTPSASSSAAATTGEPKKKSVSGGTIAGAVVGSVAGVALIAAAILFILWKRRRGDSDSDIEDDFILSGPTNEKSNNLNPPSLPTEPNPFLLAGGYKFDGDQQSQSQFVGVPSSISDNSTSYGHSRQTSQIHGGNLSFNSHGEEVYYEEGSHLQRPTMGSKKLSAGSLPDIMGGSRSLKVVNN